MINSKRHKATQNRRFRTLISTLTTCIAMSLLIMESFRNHCPSGFSPSVYKIEYEQRILITGVSGLIGRILFHHFVNNYSKKYYVIGTDQHMELSPRYQLDNRSRWNKHILPIARNRFFVCDITNKHCLNQIIEKYRIQTVIHLAAVLESDSDPQKIYRVNFEGTKNILEFPKLERIIFASSMMVVFGYLQDQPYYSIVDNSFDDKMIRSLVKLNIHDHPTKPDLRTSSVTAYCQSKIDGEHIAKKILEVNPSRSVITARLGWVNIDDDPAFYWYRSAWLSHRDLIQFFERAVQAPINISGTYFVVSDNHRLWLDISLTRKDLGYIPQDGARTF